MLSLDIERSTIAMHPASSTQNSPVEDNTMAVSEQEMVKWCETLLAGRKAAPDLTLADYIRAIPGLAAIQDVPSGTPVLVRGDVDAKPGDKIGDGDIRLRSMVDTLEFGRERGWKQIVFGHIGRKPEGSLDKVAKRLGELLKCDVPLIGDWLDESTMTILPAVSEADRRRQAGRGAHAGKHAQVRRSSACCGRPSRPTCRRLAPKLAKLANEFAEKLGKYLRVRSPVGRQPRRVQRWRCRPRWSGPCSASTCADEFDGPMMRCLDAQLVVFSGLKIDKLDDLEAMIDRGKIRACSPPARWRWRCERRPRNLDGKRLLPRRRRRSGPQGQAVLHPARARSSRPSG